MSRAKLRENYLWNSPGFQAQIEDSHLKCCIAGQNSESTLPGRTDLSYLSKYFGKVERERKPVQKRRRKIQFNSTRATFLWILPGIGI
jgi:hypothetical protein